MTRQTTYSFRDLTKPLNGALSEEGKRGTHETSAWLWEMNKRGFFTDTNIAGNNVTEGAD